MTLTALRQVFPQNPLVQFRGRSSCNRPLLLTMPRRSLRRSEEEQNAAVTDTIKRFEAGSPSSRTASSVSSFATIRSRTPWERD